MLPVGILVTTAGYVLLYWGAKLFSGNPVSFAAALGLAGANATPATSSATPGAPAAGVSAGLPKAPAARSGPAPNVPAPIVAPTP